MSITVTFTDLEAALLNQIMNSLSDPSDVDFDLINNISGKINTQCDKRAGKLELALTEYREKVTTDI